MTGIIYTVPLSGYQSTVSGVSLPVKFGQGAISGSATDATLTDVHSGATIAAVPGSIYRVIGLFVKPGSTDTTITLNSKGAGAGTAITPTFDVESKGGFTLFWGPGGIAKTKSGETLTVTSGAAAFKFYFSYVVEPV